MPRRTFAQLSWPIGGAATSCVGSTAAVARIRARRGSRTPEWAVDLRAGEVVALQDGRDERASVAGSGPTGSNEIYHGKDAISAWLQQLEFAHGAYRLGNVTCDAEGILLTEVIWHPHGRNMIFRTALHLDRGQIADQDTTVIWADPHG